MKGLLFLTFISCLATFTQGQDEIETCLFGRSTNGEGNFTSEICDLSSRRYSCESRISVHGDNTYIERKCKQRTACENNENSNAVNCYSEDAIFSGNRVCYYCCESTDCNNFDEILPLFPSP